VAEDRRQNEAPVPRLRWEFTSEIREYRGWWFRYIVDRRWGIAIPERSTSLHRTLRGAQRAAERWRRQEPRVGEVVS
jgi:hypothetical protein